MKATLMWIFSPAQAQPGSRQLPWGVEELDGVSLGPLCKNRLLSDKAMSAVGGALMEMVLCTLVPTARLVVVVGNLPVAFSPKRVKETLSVIIFFYRCGREDLLHELGDKTFCVEEEI